MNIVTRDHTSVVSIYSGDNSIQIVAAFKTQEIKNEFLKACECDPKNLAELAKKLTLYEAKHLRVFVNGVILIAI